MVGMMEGKIFSHFTSNIDVMENLTELSIVELKFINGGAVTRGSTNIYDAVYYACYLLRRSEIFTFKFWEEWGYAIL